MFTILKVLFALFFTTGLFIFLTHKKKAKLHSLCLCAISLIACFISSNIISLIPMPTEEVIITATGEKNPQSRGYEIILNKIISNGEEYSIPTPTEGKWFWRGSEYMWRSENDERKPAGITNQITIKIPTDNGRKLCFSTSEYRGIVDITYNNETKTYDLYSEESKILNIDLPNTNNVKVSVIKIFRLIFYILISLIILAYPLFAILKFSKEKINFWLIKNYDKIYYIAIAFIYIAICRHNSIDGSLWGDEVWSIGWIYDGYPYTIDLYFILIKLWFIIVPYGQENLLLLPQICVAISIIIAGLIGALYKNKRLGIILSSLVAFSTTIVYQCAMEYRPYPFLLLFSTLSFYFFIKKIKSCKSEKYIDIFLYSIFITCLMSTQLFGVMVAGLLLVADFVLLINKKSSPKSWFQFLIPGIYGIYWMFTTFLDTTTLKNNNAWIESSIAKIISILKWLCNDSELLFTILILGIILIFKHALQKKPDYEFYYSFLEMVSVLIPIVVFTVSFIYSTLIVPESSLLADRYYISIIIFILFIISITIDWLIEKACTFAATEPKMSSMCVMLLITVLCLNNWPQISSNPPYYVGDRTKDNNYLAVSEYLMKQNDIYSNTTIYILDAIEYCDSGMEYYLTQKGKRDSINHCCIYTIPDNIADYDVIYASYHHGGIRWQLQNVINDNYIEISDDKTAKVKKYVKKID